MGKSRKVDFLKRATRDKNINLRKGKIHKQKKGDVKSMRRNKKKDISARIDEGTITANVTGYLSNLKQGCASHEGRDKPYYLDDKAKIKHSLKENFAPLLRMLLEIDDDEEPDDEEDLLDDEEEEESQKDPDLADVFQDPGERRVGFADASPSDVESEEVEVPEEGESEDIEDVEGGISDVKVQELELSMFGSSGPEFRRKFIEKHGAENYEKVMDKAIRDRMKQSREMYAARDDDTAPAWAKKPLGEKDPFSGEEIPEKLRGKTPAAAAFKITDDEDQERAARSMKIPRIRAGGVDLSKKGTHITTRKGEKALEMADRGMLPYVALVKAAERRGSTDSPKEKVALELYKAYNDVKNDKIFMKSYFDSFDESLVDKLDENLRQSGARGLKLGGGLEVRDRLFRIFADAKHIDPKLILDFIKYYKNNKRDVYESNKRAEQQIDFGRGAFRGRKGVGEGEFETEVAYNPAGDQEFAIDSKRGLEKEKSGGMTDKDLGDMVSSYFGFSSQEEVGDAAEQVIERVQQNWAAGKPLDRKLLQKIGVDDKELLKVLYKTVTGGSFLNKAFVRIAEMMKQGERIPVSPSEVKELYERNLARNIEGARGYKTLLKPENAYLNNRMEKVAYPKIFATLAPDNIMRMTIRGMDTARVENPEVVEMLGSLPVEHLKDLIVSKVEASHRKGEAKRRFREKDEAEAFKKAKELRNRRMAKKADPEEIERKAEERRERTRREPPVMSMRRSPAGTRGIGSITDLSGGIEELEKRLSSESERMAQIDRALSQGNVTPINKRALEKRRLSTEKTIDRLSKLLDLHRKREQSLYLQSAEEDKPGYAKGDPFIDPPGGLERVSRADAIADEEKQEKDEAREKKEKGRKERLARIAARKKAESSPKVTDAMMKKVADDLLKKRGKTPGDKKKIAEALRSYRRRIQENGLPNNIRSLKKLVVEDIESRSLNFDLTEMLLSAESGDKEVEAGEKDKDWHKAKPLKKKDFYPKLEEALFKIRGRK